jgi:multidrug efflux pump subunit AcrA (membrane-fusion protein)
LYVSSEADIQKNTLPVKVAIHSPPAVLKPEMLVDVTFLAPKAPDSTRPKTPKLRLFVPRQLVQTMDDQAHVWLADQSSGTARLVPVQIGSDGPNGTVEITDGLKAGSRLIASGSDGLRSGSRIRVVGEEPTDWSAPQP